MYVCFKKTHSTKHAHLKIDNNYSLFIHCTILIQHSQIKKNSCTHRKYSIFERGASGNRRREVAVGRRISLPSTNRDAEHAPRRMRQRYTENQQERQERNTCVCLCRGGGNMMHRVVLVSVTVRFIYMFQFFLHKVRSGLTWNYVFTVSQIQRYMRLKA